MEWEDFVYDFGEVFTNVLNWHFPKNGSKWKMEDGKVYEIQFDEDSLFETVSLEYDCMDFEEEEYEDENVMEEFCLTEIWEWIECKCGDEVMYLSDLRNKYNLGYEYFEDKN